MMLDIWMGKGFVDSTGEFVPAIRGTNMPDIGWADLVNMLRKPTIIPFEPLPGEPGKPRQKGKDCCIPALLKTDPETGKPLTRSGEAIQHYSCVPLDIDKDGDAGAVAEALRKHDLSFVMYSTYSHNPELDGYDRFRVLVPLDRPVEGKAQYKAVADQVALLAVGAGYDKASKSYGQAFWMPAYPPERANQSIFLTHTGKAYEWVADNLLDGNGEYDPQLPNPGDEVPTRQPVVVQRQLGTKPKVSKGKRNTVLHNTLHDYLRGEPSLPEWDDFKLTVLAINNDMFDPPLVPVEALRSAKSVYDTHVKDHPEKAAFYPATDIGDFKAEPVEWLIPGQVLRGHLTVLQGSPGVGKSTLFFHWAKVLADKGKVSLIGKPEDDPSTLKKRFMAAGILADRKVLAIDDRAMRQLPFGIGLLRKQIEYYGAELVFIDAVKSWMPTDLSKQNDGALRECLEPLAKLAQELNIAIVASRHFTKDGNNTDAMSRGSGGQAYTAVARQIMQVVGGEENSHPEYPDHVLLSTVTGQHIAKATTWAFKRTAIEMPMGEKSAWVPYLLKGTEVPLSASEILKAVSPLHKTNSRKGNCAAAIVAELDAAGGRMLTGVLRETMLITHQYPSATYERALKGLADEGKIQTRRGRNQEVSLVV